MGAACNGAVMANRNLVGIAYLVMGDFAVTTVAGAFAINQRAVACAPKTPFVTSFVYGLSVALFQGVNDAIAAERRVLGTARAADGGRQGGKSKGYIQKREGERAR